MAAMQEATVIASTANCGTSISVRSSEASCAERDFPNQNPSADADNSRKAKTERGLDSYTYALRTQMSAFISMLDDVLVQESAVRWGCKPGSAAILRGRATTELRADTSR